MASCTTKELYQGKEFNEWVTRTDLIPDEIFMIRNYLDPKIKTIESGTAGGRITYSLKEMGFTSLYGFDFVPEFVAAAKAKDPDHSISFEVQDATKLTYPDNSFDQLIYLGQMISCMDTHKDHLAVMTEAYRIAKPGATLIVSFLSMNARLARPLHAAYTAFLKTMRTIRGRNTPLQAQPWLKHGGGPNLGAITDCPPYLYYFELSEINELISKPGFELIEIGSTYQLDNHLDIFKSIDELSKHPINNAIYAACRKPA